MKDSKIDRETERGASRSLCDRLRSGSCLWASRAVRGAWSPACVSLYSKSKQQLQQQITMLKQQLQQALQREQAPEQAIPLLEAAEEVMSAEQLIEKMIEQD